MFMDNGPPDFMFSTATEDRRYSEIVKRSNESTV
jgi:hypothetical protein